MRGAGYSRAMVAKPLNWVQGMDGVKCYLLDWLRSLEGLTMLRIWTIGRVTIIMMKKDSLLGGL
jgi:hypothetical protein